jgi:hypothetical protein
MYPESVQVTSMEVSSRLRSMDGSATLIMLPSRRTRNPASRHTTRVAHRRGSCSVAVSCADVVIVINFFHVWIQQWI